MTSHWSKNDMQMKYTIAQLRPRTEVHITHTHINLMVHWLKISFYKSVSNRSRNKSLGISKFDIVIRLMQNRHTCSSGCMTQFTNRATEHLP